MQGNLTNDLLSELTVFMKYSKYLESDERRESWVDLVDRNKQMHIEKFPDLKEDIEWAYKYVLDKKVLPSMRSMQFAGKPVAINPIRMFNCSYIAMDDYRSFQELMFLLLSGCGVGISVQQHHINKLPKIYKPIGANTRRYVVGDSITGWSDAIKALMKSYFGIKSVKYEFDYIDIRDKGATLITSGGKAPGAEPLKQCIENITKLLDSKSNGEPLTSIEVFDISCHIADAVLAGGIRRAAMITLFSLSDKEMMKSKSGEWWVKNPQRARSNNSVSLVRSRLKKSTFDKVFKTTRDSKSGEPGFYLTNSSEMGCNPCFSGQEELLTVQGYKTFEELCDIGEIDIVNKDGNITQSKVWCSGEKETIKFTNTLGYESVCTPDHVWMLNDGSECEAKDLAKKRLMPFINKSILFDDLYVKLGFIQGDANLSRLKSITHKGFEINIGENDNDVLDYFKYIREGDQIKFYTDEFYDLCKNLRFSCENLPERKLPDTFFSWSNVEKLSFLKGLYSANGSVIKGYRVSFKSTCLELIKQMQYTLQGFGISTYYTTNKKKQTKFLNGIYECKESYDLNISGYNDLVWFYENIGFIHEYKNQNLYQLIVKKSPYITKVEQNGVIPVYDFTEPETHWGVVNGYIAHNCCEISLRNMQFCNLTEVNASDIDSQIEFEDRIKAATIIGTLQASYTDFHYLRNQWKVNTEKDALLGVSMTGIASMSIFNFDIEKAAKKAIGVNEHYSKLIGINKAKRVTTVKPAGTTSLVMGCSSGIHAWHDKYYIRRIRISKNEPIYTYLSTYHSNLIEDDVHNPETTSVISVPQQAPEGAVTREESALDLLKRVKEVTERWIEPGHIDGYNSHNVSCTISVKETEWDDVSDWMWNNRDSYNGISILPHSDHTYQQAPFETCTKEKYEELLKNFRKIDLSLVYESEDNTNFTEQAACAGGSCELK